MQDKFLAYAYQQSLTTLEGLAKKSTTTANVPAEANTTTTALPDLSAASMRRDLRDKGVQNIVIGTIPEQMMFDVRWFVVEAGKPVQLTLTNPDFMPHNIIVGAPGVVNPIGTAAATMPAPSAPDARAYIPDLPAVLSGVAPGSARPVGHDQIHRAGRSRANTTSSAPSPATGCACMASCWSCRAWMRFEAKPTVPNNPMTGKPYESQRVVVK